MIKKSIYPAILITLILAVSPAFAITLGFNNITANNLADAATGEAQLFVDVVEDTFLSVNAAVFTFRNTGPLASSITDIYFDDDNLFSGFLGFGYPTPGVAYSQGASPPNLPGGNAISFAANRSFDSDAPVQPNGVNPLESLIIFMDLATDFTNVLAALESDDFRIGIHVQGFRSGGSESFVTGNGTTPVPEPATMLLFGVGLVGLAGFGRKKLLKK